MKVSIRQAKIEDAPLIGEAQREIAQQPGFFCSQPFELTDQSVERTISEFLSKKDGIYFVAEYENTIVGHAFLEQHQLQSLRHVADLNIVVHQGWQEQGIGTQLMEKLIEWAKSSSTIEKIELNVRASNTKAILLYKKMGFQEEGRLKNRVKVQNQYFDDIIMALDVKEDLHSNALTLRVMRQEDIAPLINTFCFPWDSPEVTTNKWNRIYREQQNSIRTVCVLEKQNQIIGYGSLLRSSEYPHFKNANIPEINDVWLKKEMRNKGFGKALILHLESIARSEGYSQIGIGVGLYRDYGSAQKLYFKMGYIPDGMGITYKCVSVAPGAQYPVDDDLILWLKKSL